MEKVENWEHNTLINELAQGKELAKQLRSHLIKSSSSSSSSSSASSSSSSPETGGFLLEKILCCYEKVLSMLNWSDPFLENTNHSFSIIQSPNSIGTNKRRHKDVSYSQAFNDQYHKDVNKKRKATMPKWTEQVRVCSEAGLQGPVDDGYCWRKYGQKEILGANFPRSYYRCTHRHVRGCLATKQVQRSEDDPTMFEVTYRGRHTCTQNQVASNRSMEQSPALGKATPMENKNHSLDIQRHQENPKTSPLDTFSVKKEDLDTRDGEIFTFFTFPATPIGPENGETSIFSDAFGENSFIDSFSSNFTSPATSESNYLSVSLGHMADNVADLHYQQHISPTDTTEILSASNSPIGDIDFSFDDVDFDPDFSFSQPENFPMNL